MAALLAALISATAKESPTPGDTLDPLVNKI